MEILFYFIYISFFYVFLEEKNERKKIHKLKICCVLHTIILFISGLRWANFCIVIRSIWWKSKLYCSIIAVAEEAQDSNDWHNNGISSVILKISKRENRNTEARKSKHSHCEYAIDKKGKQQNSNSIHSM